jgi:anti-anti-sigma factor
MVIAIEQRDDVCVLRVEGDFVTSADPEYLALKTEQLKQRKPEKVLVDLHQVPHIGSTGIGFIVGIFTTLKVNSGQMVLVGLQPHVRESFHLTRLTTIIPLSPDVTSGLACLGSSHSGALL